MSRYIIKRSIHAVITLFVVSIVVFMIVRLSGDPVLLLVPDEAPAEDYEEMRKLLRLDEHITVQYVIWMRQVLTGDLGESTTQRLPVATLILERFPATLQLTSLAFTFTLLIGLPIGVYAAAHRGGALDFLARGFAVFGQATPNFWMGIVFIMIFAVWLGWLPAAGREGGIKFLILPAVTIGWFPVAGVMRLTRSSMLEVLNSEYVKLARVKGVRESLVLWKHAFKNAALPVLTYSALIIVFMVRGSVIVETVFAWPGVGRLVLEAVYNRDFPIVQAVVLLFATFFITANLLVDITYAYLNPKIRYS
ncbi:MAG: ABC transporter permease [Chloroflexi bacterium]|nr:ABC transporter permease [Chloroflexota bacterium]